MAFTLNEQLLPVERVLSGVDSFSVIAGDRLKILNGGAEVLNEKVPNGKKWQVVISLKIEESSE